MNEVEELDAISRELRSILNELEDISTGIWRDFKGIGNERCAAAITDEMENYRKVRQRIDHVDMTLLSEKYLALYGGGETGLDTEARDGNQDSNGSGG